MALLLAGSLTDNLGRGVSALVLYALLGVLLLLLGYFVIDLTHPGSLTAVIKKERNPNASLLAATGVGAVGLVIVAAIFTSGGNLVDGLTETLVFGVVGILVQAVAIWVFDRIIGINVGDLLKEPTLSPAAVLVGVTRIVIGLVTAFALI